MSKLRSSSGDDHPDAAQKHLRDAKTLLDGGRPDGAAYLSGYVVECSLKSICALEGSSSWGHDFAGLSKAAQAVAAVAGAKSARYYGQATRNVLASPISAWTPGMRYLPEGMQEHEARAWHTIASEIYKETVFQMRLDGEL